MLLEQTAARSLLRDDDRYGKPGIAARAGGQSSLESQFGLEEMSYR